MKLSSRHKADPSFNMSSMTDVIFLLLIFFIMTSNTMPIGKQVNLPKSTEKTPTKITRVAVTLTKDLDLFVDKDEVSKETLVDKLNENLSPKDEDKYKNVIMVRGDIDVPYGKVMEIVNLCSQIDNAVVSLQLQKE